MDDTRTSYGLIDIARALTSNPDELLRTRRRLAQWHRRGKLPPADERVSGGPMWYASSIEPWIKEQQAQHKEDPPASP
jgi:hypothetical protein